MRLRAPPSDAFNHSISMDLIKYLRKKLLNNSVRVGTGSFTHAAQTRCVSSKLSENLPTKQPKNHQRTPCHFPLRHRSPPRLPATARIRLLRDSESVGCRQRTLSAGFGVQGTGLRRTLVAPHRDLPPLQARPCKNALAGARPGVLPWPITPLSKARAVAHDPARAAAACATVACTMRSHPHKMTSCSHKEIHHGNIANS